MPIYLLDGHSRFPPASNAEPSGLLAVGGDLCPRKLLEAYAAGIFPWYSADEPVMWFSPDPRAVIRTDRFRIGRGVRRTIARACALRLTMDTAFGDVIRGCAEAVRPGQNGTWITADMIESYLALHEQGYAHSVEAWNEDRLVGGVYGVCLGGYFAGESMFRRETGASMKALTALLAQLSVWNIRLFDCQLFTPHVGRMGAELWTRGVFLSALRRALIAPTRRGKWSLDAEFAL